MRSIRKLLAGLLCLGLIACGEHGTDPLVPGKIEIAQGDTQVGAVGAALAQPLVVLAKDSKGRPLPDVSVQFRIVKGGGSIEPAQATTDAKGQARAIWTLGGAAGAQEASALAGQLQTLKFTANATAGPPTLLKLLPDSVVFDAIGDSTLVAATVKDRFENEVSGAAVSWISSSPNVVSVSSDGRLTSRQAGVADIAANVGAVRATLRARVAPALSAVVLTRDTATVTALGDTLRLTAEGRDRRGVSMPGLGFAWRALDSLVASVDSLGKVTARANGTGRIVVTSGGRADTASITVAQRAVGLRIVAGERTINAIGFAAALRADPLDRNGFVAPSAELVSWRSGDASVVTVSPAGVATAHGVGQARVIASLGAQSDSTTVTVRQIIAAVSVSSPANPLSAGAQRGLTAAAADSNGVSVPVASFGWQSSDTAVAKVDAVGQVTVRKAGTSEIRATTAASGPTVTGRISLTVVPAAPAVITVVSGDGQGGTASTALPAPFIVRVTDAYANPVVGTQVQWSVVAGGGVLSLPVSTVAADGTASVQLTVGATPGTNSVQASSGAGVTATFNASGAGPIGATGGTLRVPGDLVVIAVPAGALAGPTALTITPASGSSPDPTYVPGTEYELGPSGSAFSVPLQATIHFDPASIPPGTTAAQLKIHRLINGVWVELTGNVVDPVAHTVTVPLSSSGRYAVLGERPAAALNATPDTIRLASIGATQSIVATVRDAGGHVLDVRPITYTPTNPGVATVSSSGLVNAVGNGTTDVTVALGGLSARVVVQVAQSATALTKTAGDGQSASVGTSVAVAPTVHVVDALGNPAAGATVAFTVLSGGGSVSGGTQTTDASGNAAAGGWTLGQTAGSNQLQAVVAGVTPVVFSATGTAAAATQLLKVSGDGGTLVVAGTRTLQARLVDAFGNPVSGQTVAWAAGAGSGSVSAASSVTDATGTAAIDWTAGIVAGPQTASATFGAVAGSPSTFALTATPGVANAAHSTITPATASIIADGAATVMIVVHARDQYDNDLTSGGATVVLTKTGGGSLAAVTDGANGTYAATLTAPPTAGSASITATLNGGAVPGSAAVTFAAGALHHFAVEASAGGAIGTQTAAAPFAVRITAQDVNSNTVTAFTGTVSVTSNRAASAGLGTTSAFTAGVLASHSVTLTESGVGSTLTATNNAGAEVGTSATFSVSPGALDHFLVEAQAGGAIGAQTAGTAFGIRITAQDASNNTVTSFTGAGSTVDVTSNRAGSAGLATTASFTNGVLASHGLTLTQSGSSSTISATRTSGGAQAGTSGSFTVDPAALAHFVVEAQGGGAIGTQAAGTPFNVRMTAQDASGNTVTGFTGTVNVTSNRTGSAGLTTSAAFTAGVLGSHGVTLTQAGASSTITVTNSAGAEVGTSAGFTVNPAALDHFLVEAQGGGAIGTQSAAVAFNIRVTAQDATGNTVTGFTGTADITSNRAGSAGLTTTAAFTAGVLASHSVTLTQAGASATITGTRTSGGSETGTSNAFTVSAGALDHFAVEAQGGGAIGTQVAGAPFTLGLTAQDANGNTVTGFTGSVDITSNRTGSAGLTTTAAFTAGVLSSHAVTLTQAGATSTITATRTSGAEVGTSAPFTVNSAALNHFLVEAQGGGAIGTQAAGAPFNVRITAQDASGNTVTGFNGTTDVTSNRTGSAGATTTAAFTAGVLASHGVTLTQSGAGSIITATRTSGSETGGSSPFTVNPAALDHFAVEAQGGGAIGTQAAGTPFGLRITAQDVIGNTVTGFTGTANVTSNRTGSAGLTTTAAFTAGVLASHSVTLTQSGSGSTITATRTSGGAESGTSNTFTVNPGALHHFAVEAQGGGALGPQAAGASFGVRFTAQDANDNTVTGFGGTVDVTSNRTGTAGLTTSAAFTAGVLASHAITLTTPTGAGATVIATNSSAAETGTSASFTLAPGALHHFLVEAQGGGAIGTQTAGTPLSVRLTAQDASNNTVAGFTGTASITSNRIGSAGLTTTAAFTAGVLASHGVTLTTPTGSGATITATNSAGAQTGTSAAFTLAAGVLHHFAVEAPGGGAIGAQAAGTPFNVRLTAQDANDNTVTGFTGTVDVTSNRTGTAGLTTSAAFTGGALASHSVTLATPTGAGATITVTRTTGGAESGSSNAFTLNHGALDHFAVEAPGGGAIGTQAAATSFNVQLTAQDLNNNTVTAFTGTADVTSNRTGSAGLTQTAAFTAGVLASHGVALTTPTGAGATITATNHAGVQTGTSTSFTLSPGALHHFLVEAQGGGVIGAQAAGAAFNIRVTAQDVSNNTVTTFSGTADVTSNRTGSAGLTQTAAFTAGVLASHPVTLTTPTGAGATITATNHAGAQIGTSTAFVLNPGALDHFAVESQGGGAIGGQAAGVPFNIQITAQDAGNNTTTSFTGTVDVSSNRTASAGVSPPPSAAFTAGVLASHSITLTQAGAGATITATRTGGVELGTSNAFVLGTPPTVTSTTPTNLAVSVSRASAIVVNFSTSVNATASAFTLECPAGTTKAYNLSASPASSFTLTPQAQLPGGQNCRVTVNAANVTDASTTAPMSSNYVFAFETVPDLSQADTYPQTVIGNMSVQSANVGTPYSFTTNDVSAESFTITGFDATSAHGGTVSVTTSGPNMGQFTYDPPAGYHGPNDTFTYTVTTSGGSTAIGTVTMPINGMVWFVDANAGSNGDGRLSNPFNTLASFNAINNGTGDHPAANDNVFLYESSTAYVGPVTLLSGQRLIGQDAAASLATISGLTPPSSSVSFPSMNTGAPQTLLTSAGNGVNISSGSNTLRGFRIGGVGGVGSVAGVAISGTSTGTLTVADVAITQGASGGAISLSSASAMTANIVMDSVRSSGGANAVSFTNVNGSATLQNLGTTPSNLSGASGATVVVSGGNLSVTVPATVSQANNAAMVSVTGGHSGTINFNNTLTATSGTGLQFNNADGTYNFNAAVTVGTAASQALNINNGSSGAFNLTVGSTAFTNQTGNAVAISNSAPTVDYRGTITKSSVGNGLITINGLTGGTVQFSGALSQTTSPTPAVAAISDSSSTGGTVNFSGTSKTLTTSTAGGVSLRNNTGSTINFTNGGLAITTTSANGFLSSGGGTINVSGAGNTITTTAGGAGLNVQNPTSGGALTFQSISTSGAANGIVMVSTGTGGLTVTGNTVTPGRCDVGSTTCTGGTISGATGADGQVAGNGIYLSNAPNVSLTRMRVAGTVQNFGLYGNTLSGLSLNTMLFNGTFGTATTEAALGFDELTGNPSIINSSIFPASGSFGDGLRILNTTGTALNRLTMTADTVGFTGTNGRDGVNILARGSNTTNVTVQNSTFRGGKNKTFVFTDSVTATTNLIFTNNLIQQGTGSYGAGALAALNIRTSGATTHTDSIAFNTFTNLNNPNNAAFEFNPGLPGLGLSGSVNSYIGHNTWGTSGSANSGPGHNAINIDMRGSGTTRFKVADNAMYQYGDFPFRAVAYDDGATATAGNHNGKMDLTFVRNTIQEPRAGAVFVAGVQLDAGRTSGGAMTMCVNFGVGGLNNMNNSGSTDADTPFDILSNTTGNGSFVKYLNYSGSDTGASGLAEGKLNTLIRAGISSSTFDGFLDLSQAALITSSTNNASGSVCNLPAAP